MQTFPNLFHPSALYSCIHACCMILFVTLLLRTTMYGAMWKGQEKEIRLDQITSVAFLLSFRRFDGEFWSSWSPCKADVNYVRQKKMCWSKWQYKFKPYSAVQHIWYFCIWSMLTSHRYTCTFGTIATKACVQTRCRFCFGQDWVDSRWPQKTATSIISIISAV